MPDIIEGKVIRIIDGDTFEMRVTRVGQSNTYSYNELERIRMANVNTPELRSPGGLVAKANLRRSLLNKVVRCTVRTRDVYDRVVADVAIL